MAEKAEVADETWKARLRRLRKAWLALWGALIAAILAASAGMAVICMVAQVSFNSYGIVMLAMGVAVCIPVALASSVLGLPLLLLRRWIVTPHAPYVGPGYLAVVVYGPILLALVGFDDEPPGFEFTVVLYEVIAYLATMFFARIWRSLGMFEVDAATRARRGSEPGRASSPVTTPGL